MNNPLVFVNLYPNMGISLPRYCPWLYKTCSKLCIRMHIIASLCCWDVRHRYYILFFLPPTHWLVIKFSTLFLKLVVAYVKCVSSKAMIAHLVLVKIIVVSRWLSKLLLKSIGCIIIVIYIMRVVFWVRSRLLIVLLIVLLLRILTFLHIWIVMGLPTIKRITLVFLRNCDLFLLLWSSVKIARSGSEFLHVYLRLTILRLS